MTTSNRLSRLREILRLNSLGISQRQIAMSCGCSRNTVQDVLIRCQVAKINWPLPEDLSENNILAILYPAETPASDHKKDGLVGKVAPDYKYVHQELARKGVNLKLLWSEYVTGCRSAGSDYLQYSQFCVRYRQYAHRTQATMHINHKPGEKCSVDWAGTTYDIWNQETGETIPAYLFVGTLNSSKYTFVKAYPDTKLTSWTTAHVEMFNYFQGVPQIVIPDNCKTAVVKTSTSDEPVLNQSYLEMAEYYGFAVIPARPRRHIGIINLYKADDGKNYIYLNSQGTIELSHGESCITVLLVRKFASKTYKILAKAEGVKILDFADSKLTRKERYQGQVELGLTYGGVSLVDLFNENSYQGSLEEEKNAYDEQYVRTLIDKITIHDDHLIIEFKSGIEIQIDE